jgi:hypothetical protein
MVVLPFVSRLQYFHASVNYLNYNSSNSFALCTSPRALILRPLVPSTGFQFLLWAIVAFAWVTIYRLPLSPTVLSGRFASTCSHQILVRLHQTGSASEICMMVLDFPLVMFNLFGSYARFVVSPLAPFIPCSSISCDSIRTQILFKLRGWLYRLSMQIRWLSVSCLKTKFSR